MKNSPNIIVMLVSVLFGFLFAIYFVTEYIDTPVRGGHVRACKKKCANYKGLWEMWFDKHTLTCVCSNDGEKFEIKK